MDEAQPSIRNVESRPSMTELRPYPAYRDSGVEWLGEVPEHWEVRRLKTLCHMQSGDAITALSINEVGKYPVFGGNGIRGYTAKYTHDGSFVLIGRQGALCGNVHIARGRFWASEHAVVSTLRREHDLEWHGALLDVMKLNQYSIAAAQPGLSVDRVLNLWAPVPSSDEQTAVARFLDDADRRIRRYVRAKKRLIDLLEEQKQAIIYQAVTGQIDVRTGRPYTAYKDSGVEWLGEVPKHWEVCPLRRCVKICGGMTPSMNNRRFWDGEIPWVTPKDMKKDAINNSRLTVTEAALKHTSLKEVDPGTVLIVVRGMILARTVPVAWTTVPVTINQDMKALTPCPRVNAEFLGNQLGAAQQALLSGVDVAGHGTRRLPTEHWRALPVAIPPQDEQQHIVDAVRDANRIATKATGGTQVLIECAKQYRTRLIADVVTGKLDVREAVCNLPEADPITDGNRVDTIQTASHPHAIEHDMANEAVP